MNILLWIIQILLALLFLFAGGTKLVLPADVLQSMGSPNQVQMPVLFIKFIGLVEVLGGLGLVLPGLLRIKKGLTPLAAIGLTIVMIGAVVITMAGDGIKTGDYTIDRSACYACSWRTDVEIGVRSN